MKFLDTFSVRIIDFQCLSLIIFWVGTEIDFQSIFNVFFFVLHENFWIKIELEALNFNVFLIYELA